jgi:hypothetical protein
LLTLRRESRFVFRRQDFHAPQILFRVNVLARLRLLFARAFLPRGFRSVLRFLCAALRCAEQQT